MKEGNVVDSTGKSKQVVHIARQQQFVGNPANYQHQPFLQRERAACPQARLEQQSQGAPQWRWDWQDYCLLSGKVFFISSLLMTFVVLCNTPTSCSSQHAPRGAPSASAVASPGLICMGSIATYPPACLLQGQAKKCLEVKSQVKEGPFNHFCAYSFFSSKSHLFSKSDTDTEVASIH